MDPRNEDAVLTAQAPDRRRPFRPAFPKATREAMA
jgi:hypothetical protein